MFYKSKKRNHVYSFSLLCENWNRLLWFFTYRKKIHKDTSKDTIRIQITTTIRYFKKNTLINQLKSNHNFLYIV